MASPLQNNITNLQSILNMVNNLPNGGTTVQIANDSYTSTKDGVYVNCGFKPDVVFVTLNEVWDDGYSTYFQCAGFYFYDYTESIAEWSNSLVYSEDGSGNWVYVCDIWMKRTDSGFSTGHQFLNIGTGALEFTPWTMYYVALKFT